MIPMCCLCNIHYAHLHFHHLQFLFLITAHNSQLTSLRTNLSALSPACSPLHFHLLTTVNNRKRLRGPPVELQVCGGQRLVPSWKQLRGVRFFGSCRREYLLLCCVWVVGLWRLLRGAARLRLLSYPLYFIFPAVSNTVPYAMAGALSPCTCMLT